MFSQLRGWEWLIIVALILLLFGAKRLPDAARGLGRSLRIFKAETKGLAEDDAAKAADAAAPVTPPAAVAPAAEAPAVTPPAAVTPPPAAPPAEATPVTAPAPERTEG